MEKKRGDNKKSSKLFTFFRLLWALQLFVKKSLNKIEDEAVKFSLLNFSQTLQTSLGCKSFWRMIQRGWDRARQCPMLVFEQLFAQMACTMHKCLHKGGWKVHWNWLLGQIQHFKTSSGKIWLLCFSITCLCVCSKQEITAKQTQHHSQKSKLRLRLQKHGTQFWIYMDEPSLNYWSINSNIWAILRMSGFQEYVNCIFLKLRRTWEI